MKNWLGLALVVASVALGIFATLFVRPSTGIPEKSPLLLAQGHVAWIENYRGGIRFKLREFDEVFDYSSKSGSADSVKAALQSGDTLTVAVAYGAEKHTPWGSDFSYHNVWELSIGNNPIRTFADTSSAWQSNNRFAPWGGAMLLLCAGMIARGIWKDMSSRKNGTSQ